MLFWIIQTTIISIIMIFLVHHLIQFFKDTLTIPKMKDLVNAPIQKYENMFHIINHENSNNEKENTVKSKTKENDKENMKNELKSFLKKQMNEPAASSTSISYLDNLTTPAYSAF